MCEGVVFRDHGGGPWSTMVSGKEKKKITLEGEVVGGAQMAWPGLKSAGLVRRSKAQRAIMFGCDGFRHFPLCASDNGDIHAIG